MSEKIIVAGIFFMHKGAAGGFSRLNINEEYPAILFQGPHHANL